MVDEPSSRDDSATASQETVTRVLWGNVTGSELEQLLHGLLDAMGASSLTWRAGSAKAVTAADGGRDLEAIFDRPSPDGELDRQCWWIEVKGRTGTVERSAVQQAVLDASGYPEVDILVVATNSRFSNPTRDWVAARARTSQRPTVKLWDRDNLDRLVRRYPTVAARVLPDSLSPENRLRLLVARFQELGEEPTSLDKDFFWERREWLASQPSEIFSEAVAMFLYSEGIPLPRRREWWRLLQLSDIPDALITGLINLPILTASNPLPRPLDHIRSVSASARMLIACLLLDSDDSYMEMVLNPWKYAINGEQISEDIEKLKDWQKGALSPIASFAASDLVEACSQDCQRVAADNPHELESFTPKSFWKKLIEGNSEDPGTLISESASAPCIVDTDISNGCPLVASNKMNARERLIGIRDVLRFRQEFPDDAANDCLPDFQDGATLTLLTDYGFAWRRREFP